MNPDALALIAACRAATDAALTLAAAIIEARDDPDDWRRMPTGRKRCPISGWSRSTIYRLGRDGNVRVKQVQSSTYYAGADVRRVIALTPTNP